MRENGRDQQDLEELLRSARPRGSRALIEGLAARAGGARAGLRGRRPLTVLLAGAAALALMGGIGFAASSAIESSQVSVKRVAGSGARAIEVRSAARDVYNAANPPVGVPGDPQVTLPTTPTGETQPLNVIQPGRGSALILTATMAVNESGTLNVTVQGADGENVLMNLAKSKVDGDPVGAAQAKSFRYRIIKPRSFKVEVSVPPTQITGGEKLTLRLAYTDDERQKTVKVVPGVAPTIVTLPALRIGTKTVEMSDADKASLRTMLEKWGSAVVKFRRGAVNATSIAWAGRSGRLDSIPVTLVVREGDTPVKLLADLDTTATVTSPGGKVGGRFTIALAPIQDKTVTMSTADVKKVKASTRIGSTVTITFTPDANYPIVSLRKTGAASDTDPDDPEGRRWTCSTSTGKVDICIAMSRQILVRSRAGLVGGTFAFTVSDVSPKLVVDPFRVNKATIVTKAGREMATFTVSGRAPGFERRTSVTVTVAVTVAGRRTESSMKARISDDGKFESRPLPFPVGSTAEVTVRAPAKSVQPQKFTLMSDGKPAKPVIDRAEMSIFVGEGDDVSDQ